MATTSETPEGPLTSGEGVVGISGEQASFPPFDATTFASQLLWFAITFVALYYLMAKVALPRIAGILENRRDRIAADLDQAESLKRDSEAAAAAYEKALADARSKAHGIAEAAREDAKAKSEAQRKSVEESLAKQLAEAETRIAGIKSKALAEVGAIASDTTGALVSALAGVEATAAEVQGAVQAALAEKNVRA